MIFALKVYKIALRNFGNILLVCDFRVTRSSDCRNAARHWNT